MPKVLYICSGIRKVFVMTREERVTYWLDIADEDKDELYNTLTPQACQEMIDETKQMTQWIKDKL